MSNITEEKLRYLIYQSTHRGCKETDILLGEFALTQLKSLSNDILVIYEDLILNNSDADIYAWIAKRDHQQKIPPKYQKIIKLIQDFHKQKFSIKNG